MNFNSILSVETFKSFMLHLLVIVLSSLLAMPLDCLLLSTIHCKYSVYIISPLHKNWTRNTSQNKHSEINIHVRTSNFIRQTAQKVNKILLTTRQLLNNSSPLLSMNLLQFSAVSSVKGNEAIINSYQV